MNKEQWTFLAALGLLCLGVFLAATGWRKDQKFSPPAVKHRSGVAAGAKIPAPVFPSEDDSTTFSVDGRDPFRAKTEFQDLELPELPVPPLAMQKRVAPCPQPGLGTSNLRALEELVAPGRIEFTAAPTEGSEGEGGGESEEKGEGGERKRW